MIIAKQVGIQADVADLPTGGSISLPRPLDEYRAISVNQTTDGQTLSLPNPADVSTVFSFDLVASGSADFTLHGVTLLSGSTRRFVWDGAAVVPSVSPSDLDGVLALEGTVANTNEGDVLEYGNSKGGFAERHREQQIFDGTTAWDSRTIDSLFIRVNADYTLLAPTNKPISSKNIMVTFFNNTANTNTLSLPAGQAHVIDGVVGTAIEVSPQGSTYSLRVTPGANDFIWHKLSSADNTVISNVVQASGSNTTLLNSSVFNDLDDSGITLPTIGTYLVNWGFGVRGERNGNNTGAHFQTRVSQAGNAVPGTATRHFLIDADNEIEVRYINYSKVITTTAANQTIRLQYAQNVNNNINPLFLLGFLEDRFVEAVRLN